MTKAQQSARDEAIAQLRETLKPGDTVYTVLRSVSRSGMNRKIDLYKIEDGTPHWISRLAARAAGFSFDEKRDAISVGGCGMDMGFHLVYELSHVLFPGGFGEPCQHCGKRPATQDEANDATARIKRTSCTAKAPFRHEYRGRNADTSGWDTDGGYALNHRWM